MTQNERPHKVQKKKHSGTTSPSLHAEKRNRVPKACLSCRIKKTKCDGQPRCSTCASKRNGTPCLYSDGGNVAKKKKSVSDLVAVMSECIQMLFAAHRNGQGLPGELSQLPADEHPTAHTILAKMGVTVSSADGLMCVPPTLSGHQRSCICGFADESPKERSNSSPSTLPTTPESVHQEQFNKSFGFEEVPQPEAFDFFDSDRVDHRPSGVWIDTQTTHPPYIDPILFPYTIPASSGQLRGFGPLENNDSGRLVPPESHNCGMFKRHVPKHASDVNRSKQPLFQGRVGWQPSQTESMGPLFLNDTDLFLK